MASISLPYIDNNGFITWDDEDVSEEDLPILQVRIDCHNCKVVPYIELKKIVHKQHESKVMGPLLKRKLKWR